MHVLDRFHITWHLNQALDQVRRAESGRLRAAGRAASRTTQEHALEIAAAFQPGARAGPQPTGPAAAQPSWPRRGPGRSKRHFEHFWTYKSWRHAGDFLDYWTWRALRSRLEPMKKVARMLRTHEALLLNWFKAKGEISSGAVEGLNNKIRVVTRRSYGFRTYDAMEIALYHTLGRLPEPEEFTHRFC